MAQAACTRRVPGAQKNNVKGESEMDRRDFLKMTGAASVGLAALPVLGHVSVPPASAAGESGFTFVTVSRAATIEGVQHSLFIGGSGTFTAAEVQGGGDCFLHYDNAKQSGRVLGCGPWRATGILNYAPVVKCGPTQMYAGVLDLDIELTRIVPTPGVLQGRLRLICNDPRVAAPATGRPDGVTLQIPGTPFMPGGPGGPFLPLQPVEGLTMITGGPAEAAAFDKAWEGEFQRLHGRTPTPQDRGDRIWSLDFAARNGRPPTQEEWTARWKMLSSQSLIYS